MGRERSAGGSHSARCPHHQRVRLRVAPSTAAVRRIINATCPGGLADLLGADPARSDTLAVDGKSARGSPSGDSPAAHLLAAMTGAGTAATQLRVSDETNEITCFAALLEPYDLADVAVTAAALRTQRARPLPRRAEGRALRLHRQEEPADPVCATQDPALGQTTAKFYDRSHGHGRLETRVVQVLTVTALGVDFRHAAQVAKIVRHRTRVKTGKRTRETVYVITDLTSRQASPERLAAIVCSQWTIENRLHFARDTTFAEDASKVRTGHGPENMAALRSFAINQLRAAGHANIAAGLREMFSSVLAYVWRIVDRAIRSQWASPWQASVGRAGTRRSPMGWP
ncbi:ISAs1 family transposase [Streptomyces sp. NPDC054813]